MMVFLCRAAARGMPLLWCLIVLLVGTQTEAQSTAGQSFVQQARDQAVRAYEQRVERQAHIYEGHQYVGLDPRIKIHPYYQTDSLQHGTVWLDSIRYHDIRLLYDLVRDQVLIQPIEGAYRLNLPMNRVSAFALGNRRFARLVGDSTAGVRAGFYEIIYDGRVKALAKRAKTIREDLSGTTYKGTYLVKDRYLIQKGSRFYDVKSKRGLLKIFPEQAKELRRFMRQNDLRFVEGERDQAIARTAQRYDELTRGL